jgi:hypothetical protein
MPRSRPIRGPAPPSRLWDRISLGAVAVAAIITALLVRHDRNTSTLALALAGLAGLLGILAFLLPYLTGLSGSVGASAWLSVSPPPNLRACRRRPFPSAASSTRSAARRR